MEPTCTACGREGVKTRHMTRSYGTGKNLLVIENVPVSSCPHCGKSYLDAETLHEIDRIRRERNRRATERPVAVADFATG